METLYCTPVDTKCMIVGRREVFRIDFSDILGSDVLVGPPIISEIGSPPAKLSRGNSVISPIPVVIGSTKTIPAFQCILLPLHAMRKTAGMPKGVVHVGIKCNTSNPQRNVVGTVPFRIIDAGIEP